MAARFCSDKFHFFGNYELDRTPKSLVFTTGYATFDNASQDYTDTIKMGGLRLDYQVLPQMRMFMRGAVSKDLGLGGALRHPSAARVFLPHDQRPDHDGSRRS